MSISLEKGSLPGLGAVAALALMVAALTGRRFRTGFFLFHLAVALGERWRDARVRARLGTAVSHSLADDATRPDSAERPA